jgi:hypothetical protein
MHAIADERLLDPLFGLLSLLWEIDDRPTPRSGRGLHDVINPVIAAIQAIGGEGAIAGFDALIERAGDFRWLRYHRDQVAASVLQAAGLAAAPAAASATGVPTL